mmetsp:Transcript_31961/g.52806  ORF Transcript_31961/g.52806 Transcript_31961/m.52806 type:complete len:107 (+) Transcript_31961:453-773(+)
MKGSARATPLRILASLWHTRHDFTLHAPHALVDDMVMCAPSCDQAALYIPIVDSSLMKVFSGMTIHHLGANIEAVIIDAQSWLMYVLARSNFKAVIDEGQQRHVLL